jgi:hypothetical protein
VRLENERKLVSVSASISISVSLGVLGVNMLYAGVSE